jgi:sugar phosphate isomerase/epimerase
MIYKEASPKLYQQIDTANTFHTGYDVVGLLKKYPNRHFSLHAKENVPTVDGVLGVPPKDGGKCVPWTELIAHMKTENFHRWWIVEAEGKPDSLDPSLKCIKLLRDWT